MASTSLMEFSSSKYLVSRWTWREIESRGGLDVAIGDRRAYPMFSLPSPWLEILWEARLEVFVVWCWGEMELGSVDAGSFIRRQAIVGVGTSG